MSQIANGTEHLTRKEEIYSKQCNIQNHSEELNSIFPCRKIVCKCLTRAERTWQNKWSTARQTAAGRAILTPKNKFFLPAVSHPRANFFLSIQQQPTVGFSFHSLFHPLSHTHYSRRSLLSNAQTKTHRLCYS